MSGGAAVTEDLLARGPSNFIDGAWHALPTGTEIESRDPARPDQVIWSAGVDGAAIAAAIAAARRAGASWRALEVEDRIAALERWRAAATERVDRLARLIMLETGKIASEAKAEAGLIAGKVDITLGPHSSGRIAGYEVQAGARVGRCSFRPHGVMAVLGPFNFPAHLPNGHIVLLAGNTIVFKPSDKTPAVVLAEIAEASGLPAGVFNLTMRRGPGVGTGRGRRGRRHPLHGQLAGRSSDPRSESRSSRPDRRPWSSAARTRRW